MSETLPALTDWGATKQTLHYYAKGVGVIPHGVAKVQTDLAHPKWWHISLKMGAAGLTTEKMALPDGGEFWLALNGSNHEVVLETSKGDKQTFSMTQGKTSTEFGNQLVDAVEALGVKGEFKRDEFENGEPREYDQTKAETWWQAIQVINATMSKHHDNISGEIGPVQLWPHGFDTAFEWFGTRKVSYEGAEHPSQLNFGFSPGEPSHPEPYFYSNPWPFEEEKLTAVELPHEAKWHVGDWQGSIYEYSALVGDPEASDKLFEYFAKVYEAAAPTLTV
ncbi:MAG: hypothetical protein DWQ07_09575 [Chloroflexi bacterium]|nr:MAG: hypothetical protein DWQ07_09575 [Chloroflexota bacterium]MBL1193037.1 hypothetical protein [Chloroflexota bacterium]NOH10330.1 hypothetical protein [Chloroflexota bacterium]